MESPTRLSPTIFSTRPFVELWCRSAGVRARPYELAIPGVPSAFGVSSRDRWGRRWIELGPNGLYAAIQSGAKCLDGLVRVAMAHLQSLSVESFRWNVRFDDQKLERSLVAAGLHAVESRTQLLRLETGYSTVASRFSRSIRNHIRRAEKLGVEVSAVSEEAEVHRYYAVHAELAAEKKTYPRLYPVKLFQELLAAREMASLLVARVDGEVAAGGVFFFDGDSMMYWHGAADRRFSRYYPSCALFNHAITLAIDSGFATFNFGASGGIASLEHFKSLWGAQFARCVQFQWQNPFWQRVQSIKHRLQFANA